MMNSIKPFSYRIFIINTELSRCVFFICILILLVFLKFPITVNASGLTGEYLLSDQWRGIARFYSPLTNPALLTDCNYASLKGVFSIASDAPSRLWENELTIPIGLFHSLAISIVGENGYPVQNYSDDFLTDPVNAKIGDPQHNDNYSLFLSWASNPVGHFSYGVSLKYLYMSNFGSPDNDISFDLGCTYRLFNHPVFGYHNAGLSLINCYPAKTGSISPMNYPSDISIQYMINLLNSKFFLQSKIDFHDIFNSSFIKHHKTPQSSSYFQFILNTFPFISLSSGVQLSNFNEITNWCLGFMIKAPQFNNGRDISIVYQLTNFTTRSLNSNHSLFYHFEFGKHREEIFARRFSLKADIHASDLYNRAMQNYFEGSYWESFFLFKKLLQQFPDFHKNDNALYYSGLCLENLDIREAAVKYLEDVKVTYPYSPVIHESNLALMRIFYRNEDFANVSHQYEQLVSRDVPDSIRMHAYYIMGETELLRNNNKKAVQYFTIIQDPHPSYAYAQYSAAVTRFIEGDDSYAIFNHLENCISSTENGDRTNEIKNKAFVYSGILFYEDNSLSKAVAAFRLVEPKSIYSDDAQLGLGWTAVKARQWTDCFNAGKILETTSKRPVLKAEGCLLQAYSLVMQKRYYDAEKSVQKAFESVNRYHGVSEDSLLNRKLTYENIRLNYEHLGGLISSDYVTIDNKSICDSLHNRQIEIKGSIDSYLLFIDESKRLSMFNRTLFNVKDDIDFTMAKIKEILVNLESSTLNKSQNIQLENKIKRLKTQVEKSN